MRSRHIARYRNRAVEPFSSWLDSKVDAMRQSSIVVSPELRHLSQLPLSTVTEYRRMWAFGNHYRTEDMLVGNTYLTYDSVWP